MPSTECSYCGTKLTPSENITERPTVRQHVCPKCGPIIRASDKPPEVGTERSVAAEGGTRPHIQIVVAAFALLGVAAVTLSLIGWILFTHAPVRSVKVATGAAEAERVRGEFEKKFQDLERSFQEAERDRAQLKEDWEKLRREAEKAAAERPFQPASDAQLLADLDDLTRAEMSRMRSRKADSAAAVANLNRHLEALKRASPDGAVPAPVAAGVQLLKNVHALVIRGELDRQSALGMEATPEFQQGFDEVVALVKVGGAAIPAGTEDSDVTLIEAYAQFIALLADTKVKQDIDSKDAVGKGAGKAQEAARPHD